MKTVVHPDAPLPAPLPVADTAAQAAGAPAPEPAYGAGRSEKRTALWIAAAAGGLVLLGGIGLTHLYAEGERAEERAAAEVRAAAVLTTRLDRIETWLDSRRQSLRALAGGEALRILATELAAAQASGRQTSVTPELIFLRGALERQAMAFGASGLTLLRPDGEAWMVVGDAGPDLARMPPARLSTIMETGTPVTADAGTAETRAVDLVVPVRSLQDAGETVAALAARFPAGPLMAAIEAPDALATAGESIEVTATSAPTPRTDGLLVATRQPEGLPWSLHYTRPWDAILADSRGPLVAGYLVSGAAALAVITLILGLSWRHGTATNRKLADQYQRFATRMESERHLLDTVIDGITEYLFVVDSRGRLRHANAAACALVGEPRAAMIGRPLADVLDDTETATRLLTLGQEGRLSWPTECPLGGQSRWVMVLRNPLRGEGHDHEDGWVVLVQDITDLVQERIRTESLQRAVVRALGRTAGAADPYLADQASRMERIALLIADEMGLDHDDRLTLEFTAQVSQIGKLFVPRDLLTKTERLTPEEREVIKAHIGHACALLDDLDPSLPITHTLTEITERLDGSGYPNGLSGDEISLPGRILAVADVFAARTAERSYRHAASPEDILDILKKLPDRYDAEVVAVLAGLVESGRY